MWDKGMLLACSNMMQSKGIHQTRNNNRSVWPKHLIDQMRVISLLIFLHVFACKFCV